VGNLIPRLREVEALVNGPRRPWNEWLEQNRRDAKRLRGIKDHFLRRGEIGLHHRPRFVGLQVKVRGNQQVLNDGPKRLTVSASFHMLTDRIDKFHEIEIMSSRSRRAVRGAIESIIVTLDGERGAAAQQVAELAD